MIHGKSGSFWLKGKSLVSGHEGVIPSSCVYSMLESLQLLEFILSVEEVSLPILQKIRNDVHVSSNDEKAFLFLKTINDDPIMISALREDMRQHDQGIICDYYDCLINMLTNFTLHMCLVICILLVCLFFQKACVLYVYCLLLVNQFCGLYFHENCKYPVVVYLFQIPMTNVKFTIICLKIYDVNYCMIVIVIRSHWECELVQRWSIPVLSISSSVYGSDQENKYKS